MFYSTRYLSPLGVITLASDGTHLVGLWLQGQKYFQATVDTLEENDNLPVLTAAREWLDRYFAGKKPLPWELPLKPTGSDFRREVWSILCRIPYGQVTTYGAIAQEMAATRGQSSMSSQAVGGAVGHNPISIIIPCHRVVGTNGSLTGYAGGISAKVWLLRHEGADMTGLYLPGEGGHPIEG